MGKATFGRTDAKIHPLYLVEVKSPEESKSKWSLLKLVATVPGEQAFRP